MSSLSLSSAYAKLLPNLRFGASIACRVVVWITIWLSTAQHILTFIAGLLFALHFLCDKTLLKSHSPWSVWS